MSDMDQSGPQSDANADGLNDSSGMGTQVRGGNASDGQAVYERDPLNGLNRPQGQLGQNPLNLPGGVQTAANEHTNFGPQFQPDSGHPAPGSPNYENAVQNVPATGVPAAASPSSLGAPSTDETYRAGNAQTGAPLNGGAQ